MLYPNNLNEILPLTIAVNVAGVKMQATILNDRSDMKAYRFKVRFEDGFEDVFSVVEELEETVQGSQPGFVHYWNAVVNDLYVLARIDPGMFFYVLPMNINGNDVNVWLREQKPDQGEQECIDVFYYQNLQLELYYADQSEGWCYRIPYFLAPTITREALGEELVSVMEATRSALQL